MEEATHDELAGIVDLFDALTRAELEQALVELAFRRGADVREDVVAAAVAEAIREYYLVSLPADVIEGAVDGDDSPAPAGGEGDDSPAPAGGEGDDSPARAGGEGDDSPARAGGEGADEALIVGPAAFPMLPDEGEDLPHILDVPPRSVDRAAAAEYVADRLRADADAAVESGDEARAATLIDAIYDTEAWGSVDLTETRERLLALTD